MLLPQNWRERVIRVYGEHGQQWLAQLPSLLEEARERWKLELSLPFDNLSYNLVIPVRTLTELDVVLKLGVPCAELTSEAAALSFFAGNGAVRLLDADVPRGILLLERAIPGDPLHRVQCDPEASHTAAQLMKRLWQPAPAENSFPDLERWFQAFARLRTAYQGGCGPFDPVLIANAESTFMRLNATSTRCVILHGDLHHDNIIFSMSVGWVAIDPKGLCGDPGYEIGSYMLNQLPANTSDEALIRYLDRRLAIFAHELEIERARLAGWAFCHTVLSAIWSFEESDEWHATLRVAKLLSLLNN